MEKSFKSAVAATAAHQQSPTDLTITSDWQGTLAQGIKFNFPLLKLLCDLHSAGHHVIITSSSPAHTIRDIAELAVEFGEEEGYDLHLINKLDIIPKSMLLQLTAQGKIKVDIAFDDEKISSQHIAVLDGATIRQERLDYAEPDLEVSVNKDLSTTPSLDDVRTLIANRTQPTAKRSYDTPEPH